MIKEINPSEIEFSYKFQGLCKMPFYGHPNGCPNFDHQDRCPPRVPLINKVLDFDKTMYVIYTPFNVGDFAEKMRTAHPGWKSPRQWYNPRYWQPAARKMHRQDSAGAKQEAEIELLVASPEAHGVNVTKLMKSIGIDLNWAWPPEHKTADKEYRKNRVYLVSLGGYAKK